MVLRKISTPRARGYTLIELLIMMGLLAVVGGLSLIVSMDSLRGYSFRSERDTLISALEKARSEAMNNICLSAPLAPCTDGKPHGVHFISTPTSYVIFQGLSYNASDITNETIKPQSNLITVSAPGDIVFTNLSGTTTPTSLTISDTLQNSSVIRIGSEGRIDW